MNRKQRRKRTREIIKKIKRIDKHYGHGPVPDEVLDEVYQLDNELLKLTGRDFLGHTK